MEKVEDQELTSLTETAHQMVACSSHDRATKFGGKRGVLGKFLGKIIMKMVKSLFTHIYSLFTIFVDFYIVFSIKPNA
jgi:hypothetical protein